MANTTVAYVFSDSATSPQNGQAGGAGGVLVPNMTGSFTLGAAQDVLIQFSTLLFRDGGGRSRFILYVDGNVFNVDGGNYYSVTQNENGIEQGNASWIMNLGAGSHTVAIYWSDALAIANTTFYNRYVSVDTLEIVA